jgi:TonB family protein
MPLRCLLFSSNQALAGPIWPVLAELGIEGEYCGNAVEAVERVTTQLFQIVITDWDDQPEAGFLLKTSRELKAANRPLTLAIVKEDSHLPLALQAGANSVLRNPISPEQVRDTLSTARDLLRSKMEAAAPRPAPTPVAGFGGASAAPALAPIAPPAPASRASAPASLGKTPEKAFRAGEFLQANTNPGTQFDTGSESDVAKVAEQAAVAEVDPLSELEPMAAAVEASQGESGQDTPAQEQQQEVKGWSAVKARLEKLQVTSTPAPTRSPAKPELISYDDTHGQPSPSAGLQNTESEKAAPQEVAESNAEAELFAYIDGIAEPELEPKVANAPNRLITQVAVGALVVAGVFALVKIPGARQGAEKAYASVMHAGKGWLNPPVASPPQAPAQHETFGQADDEYKLPVTGNIPDATTDPSQIRVLPVIDPTAKKNDGSGAGGAANNSASTPSQISGDGSSASQPVQGQPGQGQPNAAQTNPPQVIEQASQTPALNSPAANLPTNTAGSATSPAPVPANLPTLVATPVVRPVSPPTQSAPVQQTTSSNAIPSSLKSQIATMTPDASGNKPVDAALPSIQPVDLAESAARSLLTQQVDPVYPDSAKSSKLQGTVVLQVLIAADGSVQDAKFLQGSLVFARAAIDAVRQWHFKPYVFNGRPTSAQTVLTLHFQPPAP